VDPTIIIFVVSIFHHIATNEKITNGEDFS